MTPKKNTLGKHERLKSRKLIEHLFTKGKSFHSFPLKVLFDLVENSPVTLTAGVTASKKSFKKAVERNRIKRLIKEGYRLQKKGLETTLSLHQKKLALFIIYTGKELPESAIIFDKVRVLLARVEREIILLSEDNLSNT